MSTPSTNIYLCRGVPLNNRYDHTLYFADAAAQLAYFQSKVVRTLNDYSYVRKSWKLKVAATMEAARVWSYLFFQNGTSGKRYFYFINQIEYINDNAVELTLELDVIQTYMFDWTLRPCFVEREHSVTDEYGENTIDEGLDVGEFKVWEKESYSLCDDLAIMVAASIDLNKYYINNVEDRIIAGYYDSIFGGFELTALPITDENGKSNIPAFAGMLYKLGSETDGKLDAIFTMWQYPKKLLNLSNGSYNDPFLKYIEGAKAQTYECKARPTEIDGYKPKNNKVFQYPYCFMYATNNSGGAAVYKYEYANGGLTFRIEGNLSPDAVVRATPVSYKGVSNNYDESITVSNFPLCSWNSDPYKMWLAQNQNQQTWGYVSSALKIVGGVAAMTGGALTTSSTGGVAGGVGSVMMGTGFNMVTSGAGDIITQIAQRADMEIQPPQARGTITGSHNLSKGLLGFTFYHKTIDKYHAEIIDNFFSMYGYATRKVKIPNISSRPAWNHVKTIDSNIGGDFCAEDLKQINDIFDKGITFWKNTDVGNYEIDNRP